MAFTTSNVRVAPNGDIWRLTGSFTTAAGDTAGTITVGGAYIADVNVEEQDNVEGHNRKLDYVVGTAGATTAITVYPAGRAISNGRFSILFR